MRVVAVLHAIGSRAQGAGCRGKVGAVTAPAPSARCPPPSPAPAHLLTGAHPGGQQGRAAHAESGRAGARQAAPGKDVVGHGANPVDRGACRRGWARGPAPQACSIPKWARASGGPGARRPPKLKAGRAGRAAGSRRARATAGQSRRRPLPRGPRPHPHPRTRRANLLPVEVVLGDGAFAREPHGLPRPAAATLCGGGSVMGALAAGVPLRG